MRSRNFTKEENNLIYALYEKGIPPSQIAARIGANAGTIKAKISSWNLPPKFRASRNHAAEAYSKVDKRLPREDQFAEMLALGFSVKVIGEVMGYKDYDSANAAFQRLRRHVGKQAR